MNVTEDPRFKMIDWKTKNTIIKDYLSCVDKIKKQSEEIKYLQNNFFNEKLNLQFEIDELKEFIKLQKEEIDKLYNGKKPILNEEVKTYLMKDKSNNFYKIGKSINPKHREHTLQSEKPTIEIVKIWDKNIEKKLHNLYNDYRIRGEWFNLNKVQVKYICTNF
jgi:hypothetical protein